MAGIAGIVGPHYPEEARKTVEALCSSDSRDGKDSIVSYQNDKVSMAATRRDTLPHTASMETFVSSKGTTTVVAFAGNILNLEHIRRGLSYPATSEQSAARVLHQAYESWGANLFKRLEGYFAIAIWDGIKEELLLARDSVGVKELYFTITSDRLMFSSAAGPLCHDPRVNKKLDMDAIAEYLVFRFVSGSATLFKNVRRLLPGSILVYRKGMPIETSAYVPSTRTNRNELWRFDDAIEAVHSSLIESLEQQLNDGREYGILLSGGVDSSLLTALVCRNRSKAATFSVAFNEQEYDETPYIHATSKKFDTRHNHLTVTEKDFAKCLPQVIRLYGHPLGSPSMVPTYMLYELGATKAQFLLSGEGADGMFAGSRNFTLIKISNLPRFLKMGIRRAFSACPSLLVPQRIDEKRMKIYQVLSLSAADFFLLSNSYSSLAEVASLLPDGESRDPFTYRRSFLDSDNSLFDNLYALGMHTNIPTEPAFMNTLAHYAGVEIGFPFLDKKLIALAQEFPPAFLHRHGTGKYILKKLAERYFPKDFINKPKSGFGVPLEYWFRNNLVLGSFIDMLCEERCLERGLFKPDELLKFVARSQNKKKLSGAEAEGLLWSCVNLELWCRIFLDRTPITNLYPPSLLARRA